MQAWSSPHCCLRPLLSPIKLLRFYAIVIRRKSWEDWEPPNISKLSSNPTIKTSVLSPLSFGLANSSTVSNFGLLSQCTCRLYLSFSLQISITFCSTDQYLKRDTLVTRPTAQKFQTPMQLIWHDFDPIPCIFHQHSLFTSDESLCHSQRKCCFCKKLCYFRK